jgi:hypothetical protein
MVRGRRREREWRKDRVSVHPKDLAVALPMGKEEGQCSSQRLGLCLADGESPRRRERCEEREIREKKKERSEDLR